MGFFMGELPHLARLTNKEEKIFQDALLEW
jgi:hypothetical protein